MSSKKPVRQPRKARVAKPAANYLVRVLKHGLETKAGTAARGLVMPMRKADSDFHEKAGNVAILGVAN